LDNGQNGFIRQARDKVGKMFEEMRRTLNGVGDYSDSESEYETDSDGEDNETTDVGKSSESTNGTQNDNNNNNNIQNNTNGTSGTSGTATNNGKDGSTEEQDSDRNLFPFSDNCLRGLRFLFCLDTSTYLLIYPIATNHNLLCCGLSLSTFSCTRY